jgi:hypothetical protein
MFSLLAMFTIEPKFANEPTDKVLARMTKSNTDTLDCIAACRII